MLPLRVYRIVLALLFVLPSSSLFGATLPEFYGLYAAEKNKLHELERDYKDEQNFGPKVRILVFQQYVPMVGSKINLQRFVYVRDRILPSGEVLSHLNLWDAGSGHSVDIRTKPVKGNSEMIYVVPRKKLAPGYYQLKVGRKRLATFSVQVSRLPENPITDGHCVDLIYSNAFARTMGEKGKEVSCGESSAFYWVKAEKSGNVKDYEAYIKERPNGKHVKEAKIKVEDLYFAGCISIPTCNEYDYKYLENNGRYIQEVRIKLENIYFSECNSIPGCNNYLAHSGIGRHLEKAKIKAEDLYFAECVSVFGCNRYLERYPNEKRHEKARIKLENIYFSVCNSIPGCNQYLEKYPKGRYLEKVKNSGILKLSSAKSKQKEPISEPIGDITYLYIPSLNAEVQELRFFESGYSVPKKNNRKYTQDFSSSNTRYINWEINLKFPKPERNINFKIDAVWYKSDGTVITRSSSDGFLKQGWTSSYNNQAWGTKNGGFWKPGLYSLELSIDGKDVARRSFEVVSAKFEETRKLAERGNPKAQYDLARMYSGSWMAIRWDVSTDYKASVKWYLKAAKQGHTAAQRELAEIYLGISLSFLGQEDIPRDSKEGYAWSNITIAQDDDNDMLKFYRDHLAKEEFDPATLAEAENLSKKYYKKYVEPFQ